MLRNTSIWAFAGVLWVGGCESPQPSTARSGPVEADAGDPITASSIAWLPADVARWSAIVTAAADRHDVDARLALLVVLLESRGRPDVVSPSGARGLMQLMPATAENTARGSGLQLRDTTELDEPAVNVELGVAHLAEIVEALAIEAPLDEADVERIAIAYNGGLAVAQAAGRAALSEETRNYAERLRVLWAARADSRPPVELSAFEAPADEARR